MIAAALFIVLIVAKAIGLLGHRLPLSAWTPVAYLWQDAALAVAVAMFEQLFRLRRHFTLTLYGVLVLYVAVTLPVVRVLGTPLTIPMWRAAGSALSDSIVYYATPANISAVAGVLLLAIAAPTMTRRLTAAPIVLLLTPLAILGPLAASRVDTHGLERNAWSALAQSALPRVSAESPGDLRGNWRAPIVGTTDATDLSPLRGAASDRNIVVVSLESTAAQYLGLYGAAPDVAPNLTRLAQSAVVFDRAYAVYPESIKGLFASLCSRYPAFDRKAESLAGVGCHSPAAILADRGYQTALFHAGRFGYLGMNAVIRNRGYQLLADAGEIGGNRESSFGVDEQAVVDFMLQWIDEVPAGQKFFVTYLPIAGHHPYEASLPRAANLFPGDSEFNRYRNAIHEGDAALGRLIDGIRERGLNDRTAWLIYGDHGEAFGQHEGNYGHTFQLYEENVRVPFLVSLPGRLTQPVRSNRVVSLLDTAPTLLDLAGIAAPSDYQGRTALSGAQAMSLFFADYSLGLLGLRDGPNKFIYEIESRRSRLFDLDRDPNETDNLAGARPLLADRYERRLKEWIKTASGG